MLSFMRKALFLGQYPCVIPFTMSTFTYATISVKNMASETAADVDVTFLSEYSRNPNIQELKDRVGKVKEDLKAKGIHIYKCIERNAFLIPRLIKLRAYATVTETFRAHYQNNTPFKIADIGCCFGTEVRKLVHDGCHPEDIYAIDIHDEYWNVGYEMFRDRETLKVNTLFTDVACKEFAIEHADLMGKFDVVYTGAVLHVFAEDEVELFVRNIYNVLKKGGFYFGSTGMNPEAGVTTTPTPRKDKLRYLHSKESLKELFEKIGFTDVEVHIVDASRIDPKLYMKQHGTFSARKL